MVLVRRAATVICSASGVQATPSGGGAGIAQDASPSSQVAPGTSAR